MIDGEYVVELRDGTIKQVNPFTGTEVWTVPGRGNRPLGVPRPDPRPLLIVQHRQRDRSGQMVFGKLGAPTKRAPYVSATFQKFPHCL